jgi:uncharacterized protein (DUF2267 family)
MFLTPIAVRTGRKEGIMITVTGAQAVFSGTIQKTDEWLHEFMRQMEWDDPHRAYSALRATFHALRDRLTTEESAQLAAQLPLLLRGVWYEGWKPRERPAPIRTAAEFLQVVERNMRRDCGADTHEIVRSVFSLLINHVTEGEITDIIRTLPVELRELWL